MPGPFGQDVGTIYRAPNRTKVALPGSGTTYIDSPIRENPWAFCDRMWDFDQRVHSYTVQTTITDNVSNAGINILPGANTNTAIGFIHIPRDGYLISAKLVAEDTLGASDTNFQTFALANLLGAGGGSTAMLAATDANTTKATGGSALTAKVPRSLTLNATAANLRVNTGDVLQFTATATQSPTVSDAPTLVVEIGTIPPCLTPRSTRTAGSCLIAPVANTANGEIVAVTSATNEANVAGFDFGDQLIVPANKGWIFEAMIKPVTLAASVERIFVGMATAYNSTLSSMTERAAFRLSGSLALKAETDDNTTDSGLTDCGTTLVTATYYYLRIDASNYKQIEFWVGNKRVKILAAAAFASSMLLQPMILVQKDSGTGVPQVTVDMMRLRVRRF